MRASSVAVDPKPKVTAGDLISALRERFSDKSGWVFMQEVSNATGSRISRYADAMAMGIWKSNGIELHGFEVKISRSDWMRELDTLKKSSDFESVCHHWWLVSTPSVAKLEEIPVNWGWLKFGKTGRLTVAKRPVLNKECSLNYDFFAAALRRANCKAPVGLADKLSHGVSEYNRGYAAGKLRASADFERREAQHARLRDEVAKFKAVTGIDIGSRSSDSASIGEAVRLLTTKRKPSHYERQLETVQSILTQMQEAVENDKRKVTSLLKMWPKNAGE